MLQMIQEPDDHFKLEANMKQETLELNTTCYPEVPSLSSSQGNLDPGFRPLHGRQPRNWHDREHAVPVPVDCIAEAASRKRHGTVRGSCIRARVTTKRCGRESHLKVNTDEYYYSTLS